MENKFGKFLDWVIQTHRLDIQTIANRTKLSRSTVYRHLRGETQPRPSDREEYAKALNYDHAITFDADWMGWTPPAHFQFKHSEPKGDDLSDMPRHDPPSPTGKPTLPPRASKPPVRREEHWVATSKDWKAFITHNVELFAQEYNRPPHEVANEMVELYNTKTYNEEITGRTGVVGGRHPSTNETAAAPPRSTPTRSPEQSRLLAPESVKLSAPAPSTPRPRRASKHGQKKRPG